MSEPGSPRRFKTYAPRRLSVFRQGYSLFVAILKFTLPLVALFIVGLLISRLTGGSSLQKNIAGIPSTEKTTPGQIELVQPKYEGVDDQGRPYTVTADKAIRAVNAPDSINFTNPAADITLKDQSWLAVKARTGTFDHKEEVLDLKDDVTIFHDSGNEMHLQALEINLKKKSAHSDTPVQVQGPLGTITAHNLSVLDQGDLVVFGGPATLKIFRLSAGKARG